MNKVFSRALSASILLGGVATTVPAWAEGDTGAFSISNFSADLYGTTQYMFRGISNTEGPAIQGDVNWTWNGFYLTAWGSNTKFSDSDIEIDYYGGYRWSWSGFNFDVGGLYYTFPGDSCRFTGLSDGSAADAGGTVDFASGSALCPDTDYFEVQGIANYTFADAFLKPSLTFKYEFSPDFYGSDGTAHAFEGDLALTIPTTLFGDVGIIAAGGYQTVEGDESSGKRLCFGFAGGTSNDSACGAGFGPVLDGYDYAWWRLGVNKNIAGFLVDVSYYGTDESDDLKFFYAQTAIPGADLNPRDMIEPHVVLTVSRNFTFP